MVKSVLTKLSLILIFTSLLLAQDGFNVTFNGVTDNNDGTYTWSYTIANVDQNNDLSHWVLGLCETENYNIIESHPTYSDINTDPSTGTYGIKWDVRIEKGKSKTFTFTVDKNYEQVTEDYSLKYSTKVSYGEITAPGCDETDCDGQIGDRVWLDFFGEGSDKNCNGIQDAGEPGIAGVTLFLKDAEGNIIDQTVTDENGNYYFDVTGLCESYECGECDGKVSQLTLRYDGSTPDAHITVYQKKNDDIIFDGVVQPGESFTFTGTDKGTMGTEIKVFVNGHENVRIHTSCSQPIGIGMTFGDFYVLDGFSKNGGRFCPLDFGSQEKCFTVEVDLSSLPDGYTATDVMSGSNTEIDNNPNPSIVCLTPENNTDHSIDFGFCPPAEECENTIGDFIWHDSDVDGIQDNDEEGIEGVVVELFDGSNTFTTTSDANGYYEFTNLPNGTYEVKISESNYTSGVLESTDQTKWYPTKKNQGNDDALDSDAGKNESVTVTLDCNDNFTIDFGFYKTCVSLIKEGPETAKPGDVITYHFRIENCGDVKLGGGVDVYDELINPSGNHWINNISLGAGEKYHFTRDYTVKEEDCGQLVNHAWAIGHPVDATADVRFDAYWTTEVDCSSPCEGEIGDRIWLDYTPDKTDFNCNGIQDDEENIGEDGEPGLENVRVLLKNANGDILDEEFTNEHGNYLFTKLCAGTYYVFVDESTIPSDYTPAPSDQGNDDVDSDQNGVKVVLGSDDAVDYSVDFGYCAPEEEPEVDIEINKSTMGTNLEDGDQFTYIISVINNGPDDATGVKVSDQLPDGVVYIGHTASAGTFDNNTGEWMVGNLPNGQTETLEITVQVDVDEVNNATFNLGPAADYNLFVLYDVTQPSSDTEGRVAVGRDANFANYSIGDKLPPNSGDVLVVGRNLEYTSGAVYNGNVVYGNNTNLDSNYYAVSISGGTLRKDYPIDFPAARSYLKGLSNTLFGYATNGSTTMEWGGLKLEGTNPLLNVFKVDGSDLSNANNVSISVPNGSVVLVNISGDNISWSGGLTVTGTSIGNVLYNFKQAKNITIQGIDVRGSILAPKAHVNFTAGVQNGQMICKSLEGAGQFNNTQFIGNIPVETEIVNIATVIGVIEFDTNENNDSDEATVVINAQDDGEGDGEGGGDGDGNDWEFVGGFLEGQIVWSLTYTDDGCILVGTIGGAIYKSNPDGTEFIQINEGMNVGFVWALLVHNGYYYAGTEQGVFRYDGSSWTLVGLDGMDVRSLVVVDRKIYAGVWLGGVYVSSDDGNTWSSINSDMLSWAAVHDITANVTVDFNVELFVATLGNGVCFSPDGGESWTKLNLEYNFVWSIASTSTGTLFAGTYGDGLYTSDDNGQNWTKVVGVNAQYIYDITVDAEDNVYISTLLGGIYTSNNGGSSFSNAGMGGFGTSSVLAFGTSESSSVYVGTSDGSIYRKITGDGVTSVGNEEDIPKEFRLDQNYPNPFNPSTTIQFAVPKAGEYKVVVYNILGQQVAELLNTQLQPGVHKVEFGGNNLASGIYIYQLIGNEVNFTKKMILMK